MKPDEATRDRFVKASSSLSPPQGGDEIKNRDGYDPNQPRDRDGKWTSGVGSVLSSKPMSGGDDVVELHREHGAPRAKREIRARSGGLSATEIARLKPHLPKFLAEKMAVASAQDANLDAMGAFEIPDDAIPRIKGVLVTEAELAEARDVLHKIGVGLEVGTQNMRLDLAGMVAAFDGKDSHAVLVRENPTIYELAHECLHAIHWHLIGKQKYLTLTKFEKEDFVFEGLSNFFGSGVLNDDEISHAKWYIDDVNSQFESRLRPKE